MHLHHCKRQTSLLESKHSVSYRRTKIGRWPNLCNQNPQFFCLLNMLPKTKTTFTSYCLYLSQDKPDRGVCAYSRCSSMSKNPAAPLCLASLDMHRDVKWLRPDQTRMTFTSTHWLFTLCEGRVWSHQFHLSATSERICSSKCLQLTNICHSTFHPHIQSFVQSLLV